MASFHSSEISPLAFPLPPAPAPSTTEPQRRRSNRVLDKSRLASETAAAAAAAAVQETPSADAKQPWSSASKTLASSHTQPHATAAPAQKKKRKNAGLEPAASFPNLRRDAGRGAATALGEGKAKVKGTGQARVEVLAPSDIAPNASATQQQQQQQAKRRHRGLKPAVSFPNLRRRSSTGVLLPPTSALTSDSTAAAERKPSHFRFMDLPPELRLIVYDEYFQDILSSSCVCQIYSWGHHIPIDPYYASTPELLHVSRAVRAETDPVFQQCLLDCRELDGYEPGSGCVPPC